MNLLTLLANQEVVFTSALIVLLIVLFLQEEIIQTWAGGHGQDTGAATMSHSELSPPTAPVTLRTQEKIQSTINNFDIYWSIQTIDPPLRPC